MKMYVILMNYYNGLHYEDRDDCYGIFCGVFSTCDRAKNMVAALCNKEMPHLRDRSEVLEGSTIQVTTETPDEPEVIARTTMRFETYGGPGFLEYEIVESEVDPEISACRFS